MVTNASIGESKACNQRKLLAGEGLMRAGNHAILQCCPDHKLLVSCNRSDADSRFWAAQPVLCSLCQRSSWHAQSIILVIDHDSLTTE